MKVIALDPSSSCVGYAVLDEDAKFVEAGRIRPLKSKMDANERIDSMCADLVDLLDEHRPDEVVIEDTSGKVARYRHGGGGAGLAVYGKALGQVVGTVKSKMPAARVHLIKENVWTRGQRKGKRAIRMACVYHGKYRIERDPGGDVADALGLGLFWINQNRIEHLRGTK